MKVALAQLNYHIGNIEANTEKIIQAINEAKQTDTDLIIFAELAICGYPPLDFLETNQFITRCELAMKQITAACQNIACIVGTPVRNLASRGKDLHNSALFIHNGEVKATVHKTLLPNYDVFDEYRYFEPANKLSCIHFMGHTIALTICEDLWNLNQNPLYTESPMEILMKEKPDLMINIAASPFDYNHHQERIAVLKNNCKTYQLPLLYVNQIGAQTELLFDGRSIVLNKEGQIIDELPAFGEAVKIYHLDQLFTSDENDHLLNTSPNNIALMHDALVLGIRDYFQKSGFQKAILGLSGGVDSALICALAAKALGPNNVMAVLMPSEFSSDHSISDALDLVKKLGCKHEIIAIKEAVTAFETMMHPLFKNLPFNVAEENIQSRCRMITVMAMANKFGYVLLNSSNKSELSVGYGTLYGDMAGALGVIGDLYKVQVYQLCDYINKDKEIIPSNILTKAPSAELRPGQKDSDSLPDYDILDRILFEYIELKKDAASIIALGFDQMIVHRVLKLVNAAEFKRYQGPPILRISPKAFGLGRRMPIVAQYLT